MLHILSFKSFFINEGRRRVHESTDVAYASEGRLVSQKEYMESKTRGLKYIESLSRTSSSLTDINTNFDKVAKELYNKTVLIEWGGATYNPRSGEYASEGFASAAGVKGVEMRLDEANDLNTFKKYLRIFLGMNKDILKRDNYYIGTFRDDMKKSVDIDVSILIQDYSTAEDVQLALGLNGGAYDFATGDGVFAPRLEDTEASVYNI